jgi:hypothetical protein
VFFRFTTSDEILPDPELEPPSAELSLVKSPANTGTSCGPYAATGCMTVAEPADLKVILRDGDTVTSEFPLTEAQTPLLLWTLPTCIDLVRQAPTGRRSPALSFCGNDLTLLAKPQNQRQAGPFAVPSEGPSEEPSSDPPPRPATSAAGEGAPPPMAADGQRRLEIHGCTAAPGRSASRSVASLSLTLMLGVLALLRRRNKR